MDADGDYIPKSVLNGNIRSIRAWEEWKKSKANVQTLSANKCIHGTARVSLNDFGQYRATQKHNGF